MPHLGDIAVEVRLTDRNNPRSFEQLEALVSALRRFRGQPPLESDGKVRISFNSVQFMPKAINVGFLDDVPWDIRSQALNFTRYGLCLPPNSVDEFHCYGFAHRIRSDCELTHFFEHVFYCLKHGGTCHFRATNLMELMERCIDAKGRDNELHVVERQLFTGQDRSGLYFNQACLNKARLVSRMRHSGFLRIEVEEDESPDSAALPKEADQIWLREFTPEQMERCLSSRDCIMPGCNGRRWFKLYRPSEFSIYCKKHFRKAHAKYLTELNRRLAVRWSSVKPEPEETAPLTGRQCLIPELAGDAPIWRGVRMPLGTLTAPVSLTGEGATCNPDSLKEMVSAVREFRCLEPLGEGFKISYNSDRFVPECINVGNIRAEWEWDVAASKFDFSVDGLPLPPESADEFRCHGYIQRLRRPELEGFVRSVHRTTRPFGRFFGSWNNLDAAKRKFLEASGMSDPALAAMCLGEPLTPEAMKSILEAAGFAVLEIRRGGGRYASVEDVLLPRADRDMARANRFRPPPDEGHDECCVCGKPRFWPQDGIRATGVDPFSCPSIYCRRHFTHAARLLHADITAKAVLTFEAVKKYRVSAGRRIRIR